VHRLGPAQAPDALTLLLLHGTALLARTDQLAVFVTDAVARHRLDASRLAAAGFSAGANAAALLVRRPACCGPPAGRSDGGPGRAR